MKQDSIRAVFLATLLICFAGAAAGFGYMPGTTARTAAPGDTVSFTVYVAGTPVSATASAPASWTVEASPSTVTEDTMPTRTVQRDDGYVTVRPVTVSVTVPDDATDGDYRAALRLRQTASGGAVGTALDLAQVQSVPFTITVEAGYTPPEQETSTQTQEADAGSGSSGGGGGGISGALSSIGDALTGEDEETTDTDTEDNETGDAETRQPIGGTDDRETDRDEEAPPEDDSSGTGTGLLAGGMSSPAFILFELLWVVVIGYVLIRRYR